VAHHRRQTRRPAGRRWSTATPRPPDQVRGRPGGPDQSLSAGWSSPGRRFKSYPRNHPERSPSPSFRHARPRRRPSRWDAGPISGQLQRQGAVGGKDSPYDEKSDSTPIDPTIHTIPCVWPLAQHRQVVSRTVTGDYPTPLSAIIGVRRRPASPPFAAPAKREQIGGHGVAQRERSSGASSESAPRATASRIVAANPVLPHSRQSAIASVRCSAHAAAAGMKAGLSSCLWLARAAAIRLSAFRVMR